jgi:putative methyltransferase (TIGR04325 family)
MKKLVKLLTPSILLDLVKRFTPYGWKGDYKTWQEARDDSIGYDNYEILNKVRDSLLQVKKGKAIYERDSVIFDEIQYSWQTLAGLMFAYAKLGGVNVVDFGGSLGSTYYQNKKFLDKLENISWNIIEQQHFVKVGKKDFEDDRLKFFENIEKCIESTTPNVLLLSSVLQYIENPYELLDSLLKYNFDYVLIDRTPFSKITEKIKLQIVPPSIYKASYPCRFFDKDRFLKYFESNKYDKLEDYKSLDGEDREYEFKGIIFEKNN